MYPRTIISYEYFHPGVSAYALIHINLTCKTHFSCKSISILLCTVHPQSMGAWLGKVQFNKQSEEFLLSLFIFNCSIFNKYIYLWSNMCQILSCAEVWAGGQTVITTFNSTLPLSSDEGQLTRKKKIENFFNNSVHPGLRDTIYSSLRFCPEIWPIS